MDDIDVSITICYIGLTGSISHSLPVCENFALQLLRTFLQFCIYTAVCMLTHLFDKHGFSLRKPNTTLLHGKIWF